MHVVCVWLATFVGFASAQSSIELRPSIRITRGEAVTLSHIAKLEGPDAAALGNTVIRDAEHAESGVVTIEEVQRVLEANGRVNWGRIAIRGSKCTLSGAATSPGEKQSSETKTPAAEPPDDNPPIAGTVRAAMIARVAQLLRVEPDELRITFNSSDSEFLALPTTGRTLEIRAAAVADRLPLVVTIFQGDRIVGSPRTVRTTVQVRRSVVVAGAAVRRGVMVGPDDVRTEVRWIGPTARPAAMESVVGTVAKSHLEPGTVIMDDDVAPAVAVSKGEVVTIRCVSGSLALTTRGRALADGRDGEIVDFQALDSKRVFRARMNGRGRAVIAADGEDSGQPDGRSGPNRSPPESSTQTRVEPPSTGGLEAMR